MAPRKRRTSTGRTLKSVEARTAALLQEERDELALEAWKLRKDGADWWEIADRLRITPAASKTLVADGIKAAADMVSSVTKSQLLQLEVDRVDDITRMLSKEAQKDGANLPQIASRLMDAIKLRVDLLELNQTVAVNSQQQTVVIAGNDEQYIAALQAIADGKVEIVQGAVVDTEETGT